MSSNSYVTDQRVIAFFSRREDAYRAIEALRDAGFPNEQIGFVSQDDLNSSSVSASNSAEAEPRGHDRSFWQSVKDFFSGESHDDYDYQSHYSDVTGDLGWTEDRAEYYRRGIGSGGALVTVTGDRVLEARTLLEANGGDLREKGFDMAAWQSSPAGRAAEDYSGQRIQLRGERLRAYKERVQRGEVKVRKEVVTEKQNIQVPVTREDLVIERIPASGDVPAAGAIGSDQDIRVPLSEERVRVEKQPVVNEEVRVGKRQVQRSEQVSDDVRHEELRVDKEGDVDVDTGRKRIRKDPAA